MLKIAEKEIVGVAQFKAKKGKEEELLNALHALLAPSRQEAGILRYELNQTINDPGTYIIVEKFASQEGFDFHRNTPHIKHWLNDLAPNLLESYALTLCKEIL
jgi:quinol monooxygenase YgiN